MEANVAPSLQFSTWIDCLKMIRRPHSSLQLPQRCREQQRPQVLVSSCFQLKRASTCHRFVALKVSSSFNNHCPGSELDPEGFPASLDEAMILKSKSEEIEPHLHGQCIYLIGMMGSGKTTVGRILAEALGYSFFDSDKLIEDAVEGAPVSEIFKLYGERFFRDNETEVLRKLAAMHRLVISTGGGVVTQPINWKYMQKGISLWLDVPLEALARRIVDAGTQSRPLLHQDSDDIFAKTLIRLSTLMKERGGAYENADARVSLESIAAKLGYKEVCNLTPTVIAIEALVQIDKFLKK